MSVATLVAIIGVSGLVATRLSTRTAVQGNDWTEAGALAQSAAELAVSLLSADSAWRSHYTSGVETSTVAFGRGTLSFKLVDETDGNLADNPGHSARIYGIGRVGEAVRVFSVKICGKDALTCLNASLTVNSDINFNTSTITATGQTVASNANIYGYKATVNANVEAAGTIYPQNASLNGTQQSGVPVRGMPGSDVFDYYLGSGTSIPISAIPNNTSGIRAIRNAVVSPASNPYGSALNPQGIYVIDCQGQQLMIYGCRMVGTLVLLNPGAGSQIGDADTDVPVNWAPAVANYPCLLVRGDFLLSFNGKSGRAVEEAKAGNLNPPGTPYPYPSGTTNSTATDTYPSEVAGLVYVSGNVVGYDWWPNIHMVVAGGTYDAMNDTLYLSYDSTFYDNPPPGFRGMGQMLPLAGTWRWEGMP
jgi:hypothetical protein